MASTFTYWTRYTRLEHIDIQFYYVRDEINSGRINFVYITSINIAADGLIKSLVGL